MQLQNEVQNSPAVKKVCDFQEGYCEKNDIQDGCQEMAVMVGKYQNFNNDNSGKFGA